MEYEQTENLMLVSVIPGGQGIHPIGLQWNENLLKADQEESQNNDEKSVLKKTWVLNGEEMATHR